MNTQYSRTKIKARPFEEAQYMASLAVAHVKSRAGVTPDMLWGAGMVALKEAYGVAQ